MPDSLAEFIDLHRAEPWPFWSEADIVAASAALHGAYATFMAERYPEYRVLAIKEFAQALEAAGFRKTRLSAGIVYLGLTVETRLERARREARWRLRLAGLTRARADHEARRGHSHCSCDTPQDVIDRVHADAEADEAGIAAIIEAEFAPYLAWRHGDRHPRDVAWEVEVARRRAAGDPTIEAEVAAWERMRASFERLDVRLRRLERDSAQDADAW